MRIRRLLLTTLCAAMAIAGMAPAFADDGWHRRDHQEWREHDQHADQWPDHEWREHERHGDHWREHEWREHEWREHHAWEHQYSAPVIVAPSDGYYVLPRAYYAGPGYYR